MAEHTKLLHNLAKWATLFALIVIVAGAFTRLTDAGLGCPDWPGCYGYLKVPMTEQQIEIAELRYPDSPVEIAKAWIEMGHRYLAGFFGLLLFSMLAIAWYRRQYLPKGALAVAHGLAGLVIFQALLGMWTVTELLKPVIVMGHLMGGMTLIALVWWLKLSLSPNKALALGYDYLKVKPWVILGVILLILQIALGGWVSANYAALACPGFPTCYPDAPMRWDFINGFDLNGFVYTMNNEAMATIQMLHRIGALLVAIYWGGFGIYCLSQTTTVMRSIGWTLLLLLTMQLLLGVANVLYNLAYLSVAVAHNGVAALLLLITVTLLFVVSKRST